MENESLRHALLDINESNVQGIEVKYSNKSG